MLALTIVCHVDARDLQLLKDARDLQELIDMVMQKNGICYCKNESTEGTEVEVVYCENESTLGPACKKTSSLFSILILAMNNCRKRYYAHL